MLPSAGGSCSSPPPIPCSHHSHQLQTGPHAWSPLLWRPVRRPGAAGGWREPGYQGSTTSPRGYTTRCHGSKKLLGRQPKIKHQHGGNESSYCPYIRTLNLFQNFQVWGRQVRGNYFNSALGKMHFYEEFLRICE